MSRYNLCSRAKVQNPTEGNTIGESVSQKISVKNFPAQPLGLSIPAHLLPPLAEDPDLRPPELSEDYVPHTRVPVIDPDSDLTTPLDDERPNPLASIRPDDSDASISNKDPSNISATSGEYINVLKSMSTLSLSPNEQTQSIGTEYYQMALYAINTVDEDENDDDGNVSQSDDPQARARDLTTGEITDDQFEIMKQRSANPNELANPKASGSRDKGKNVDPRNWGNLEIPDHELDLEAQRRALEEAAGRCSCSEPGRYKCFGYVHAGHSNSVKESKYIIDVIETKVDLKVEKTVSSQPDKRVKESEKKMKQTSPKADSRGHNTLWQQ
ncbi:hypothetical protein Agabi119p4_4922 [Agaricus bisporus var. burnettii]|uniref:Uncharacterized protein n=1 Tax=Agaricus bisporus var. burnettii TaxID=192524 RepID=A0A8H7F4J3_AGABI|nr:hypothetical protein Agabi119p4_4922 [Agaricus bisporus var. burnettii]